MGLNTIFVQATSMIDLTIMSPIICGIAIVTTIIVGCMMLLTVQTCDGTAIASITIQLEKASLSTVKLANLYMKVRYLL